MAKKKKKVEEKKKDRRTVEEKNLDQGREIIRNNRFMCGLASWTGLEDDRDMGKGNAFRVDRDGEIYVNKKELLTPKQWAHALILCRLHLMFGHFDADKMPGYERINEEGKKEKVVECDQKIWNLACDAYIARFLEEVKFGEPFYDYSFLRNLSSQADELQIYQYLVETNVAEKMQFRMDMEGLDRPIVYDEEAGEYNHYAEHFADDLVDAMTYAVRVAGGHEKDVARRTRAERAAQWFINEYPLLGGLAAAFQIIEDSRVCIQEEIQIAAVDVQAGEIYVNPSANLSEEELKFVLAHEYLHVGLQHQERCQGRDPYLWNIACDFVINGWLEEMGIGHMPEIGLMYDKNLKGMSAEEIYDLLLENMRYYSKITTFRGYKQGDILDRRGTGRSFGKNGKNGKNGKSGIDADEFCRSALAQGLEYHQSAGGRGFIPAGLIEEIRALAMPPIPWDVELARWFDQYFAPLVPKRTYARPSRRQGATPDIPRPRYIKNVELENARTFGVVVDTSGSMSAKMIGMALGSIASYAAAKEVPYARVVFCDADAYDAGYLAPEEIAGRVQVKGRGGTILQPGVDLLEKAEDFPKDGPILIITDGEIEDKMYIHHEHAFLIPRGRRLPFKARGKVFYFE